MTKKREPWFSLKKQVSTSLTYPTNGRPIGTFKYTFFLVRKLAKAYNQRICLNNLLYNTTFFRRIPFI